MPDVVDSRSAIFDAALDAIITVNHEGRNLELNAAAEELFGGSAFLAFAAVAYVWVRPTSPRCPAERR